MAVSSRKYFRKVTRFEIARNPDYSDVLEAFELSEEYEITRYKRLEFLAGTGGDEVALDPFGAVEDIIILNRDASNFVDTTHRTTPGGATDQNTRVDAKKAVSLGDVTPATSITLTANGADVECEVLVVGTV